MLILLASLWSGADFVLHSAGILHRYLAMSYEKFVLDEEACAIVLRTLCAFDVSEATLALDEIFRVGPGGEFVTSTHTLQWHSRELWRSVLFDRTGYEGQHPEGVLGLLRRAGDLARERIASCREPVLSEQQDGEVQEYLSEARRRYSPTGSRAGHV
jgi:trimethylamine--corrinoid protein Co-methyltransferase